VQHERLASRRTSRPVTRAPDSHSVAVTATDGSLPLTVPRHCVHGIGSCRGRSSASVANDTDGTSASSATSFMWWCTREPAAFFRGS
jgi:hypothetical protein